MSFGEAAPAVCQQALHDRLGIVQMLPFPVFCLQDAARKALQDAFKVRHCNSTVSS